MILDKLERTEQAQMRGVSKYQFVSKRRSMAFYERVLYDVRRLFYEFV